jgi:hypothetical protein
MMTDRTKTGIAVIAACAACCAPLIAPPLLAAFAAGGAGLFIADEVWCALALAAALGGYVLYRRHRLAGKARAAAACGCPPDRGCNAGNACDLPDRAA